MYTCFTYPFVLVGDDYRWLIMKKFTKYVFLESNIKVFIALSISNQFSWSEGIGF